MMRKIVILAALMWANPVEAQTQSSVDDIKFCAMVGKLAASVMEARQNETSYAEMLAVMHISESRYVQAVGKLMVDEAYSLSRMHDPENKAILVRSFANSWERTCFQSKAKGRINER